MIFQYCHLNSAHSDLIAYIFRHVVEAYEALGDI